MSPRRGFRSANSGVDVTDQGPRNEPKDRDRADPRGDREEERRLLRRSRAGDTKAYGRLVLAHQDLIYGLVLRMVRDPSLAEEITQDAFVKAYRGLGFFREESRFSTWLYRIAVNLCHDQRQSQSARSRSRETHLEEPDLDKLDPGKVTRPDQVVEAAEAAANFQAGIDALDAKYREAFLLRHQEGLSYGEIAEILQISESNAKVRVHRARETVIQVLRSRGFEV